MMRIFFISGLLLCTAEFAGAENSVPTLDDLLQRHAAARGGVAALESVDVLALELELTEPAFTVQGRYVATRDGMVRVDIFAANQRVFSEAINEQGGWQWSAQNPDEVKTLSPDGAAALERGRVGNLYALHELPTVGYELRYRGLEQLGGNSFHVVETIAPGGFQRDVYLDPETFRVAAKAEVSALHPDVNPKASAQITRAVNYQTVSGIVFISESEKTERNGGAVLQSTVVTSSAVNPEVPDGYFNPEFPVPGPPARIP